MKNIFNFTIKIDCSSSSLINHIFHTHYNAKIIIFDSIAFSTYQECANECNKLILQIAKILHDQTDVLHYVAWEANPSSKIDIGHLTPANEWQPGELVRMYLTTKNEVPTSIDDLTYVVQAIIEMQARNPQASQLN